MEFLLFSYKRVYCAFWDIEGILNLKCKAVYKKDNKVTIHSQFAGKRSDFSDFGVCVSILLDVLLKTT